MNRLRRISGSPAWIFALALAILVVSPGLAVAQVLGLGWASGYPWYGYDRFGQPGIVYGTPWYGTSYTYPFLDAGVVFPGLYPAYGFGYPDLYPGYGYGYPGLYPAGVPATTANPGLSAAPNPVASPRILTGAEEQPRNGGQDRVAPQTGTGIGVRDRPESGAQARESPPIYRGPPPLGNQETTPPEP